MQNTIAVALITSISTLTGGALTGLVAVWVNRMQLNSARFSADLDRVEQRMSRHRELRRDSYIEFLGHWGKVEDLLVTLWRQPSPPAEMVASLRDYRDYSEAENAIYEWRDAMNLVVLEGPEEVGILALEIYVQEAGYLAKVAETLRANHGSEQSIGQIDRNARNGQNSARYLGRGKFINAATKAVGGDLPSEVTRTQV
ncbi:hypothetical protein OG244_28890 [Streptomyces brevispora]|uniref:hypothetical protein n=1 Tax=Streptomyces brevispora TaxID=887462 RepID=UPI002E2F7D08|nr:hypothetical protein [Streptomyces brevispora]